MQNREKSRQPDSASWSVIEAAANDFETAWKSGQAPEISSYLQAWPAAESPAIRRDLLTELVMIDLEYRWRRVAEGRSAQDSPGEAVPCPPRLADYVARYPEFGPLERLAGELIAEEYRARRLWGDRPTHEQYVREFGQNRPGLAKVLADVDQELEARPGTPEPAETIDAPPASSDVVSSPPASPSPKSPAAHEASDHGYFRVLHPLAKGGMGQVSLAEDRSLQRQVVIKEILDPLTKNPAVRRRFVAEARITGRLEHPGVVPVYALGVDRHGQPFYAMRRVQGRTYAEAIAEYHKQPSLAGLRELLRRFVAICQTVAYAHARGIIHRDLKPANVMLGDFGETLVLDWGLAKPVQGADQSTLGDLASEELSQRPDVTAPGAQLGSPPYMAPEQAEGKVEAIGPATDVYGLGAILYQVLAASAPYSGKSSAEIIEHVRSAAPQKPTEMNPSVPRPLEAICLKAMQRLPEDRYRDPLALASDVQNWLDDEPVSVYRGRIWERAFRWMRHHPKTTVAALVCFLSLATAAAVGTVVVQKERARTAAATQLAADYARKAEELQRKADRLGQEAEQARRQSLEAVEVAFAAGSEARDAKAKVRVLQERIKTDAANAGQLKQQLQAEEAKVVAAETRTTDETRKAQLAKDRAEKLEQECSQLQREADRLRELAAEMSRLASGQPPEPPPPPTEAAIPEDFTKEPTPTCDLSAGDGQFSLMTRDPSMRLTADSSLRIDTLSQTGVRFTYPAGRNARWNLADQKFFRFSLKAPDPKKECLQNVQIRLGRGSSYFEYQAPGSVLDQARLGWVRAAIPLSGDADWQRREANRPDLTGIDWVEFHAATNAGQLTFWLDDLGFSSEVRALRPELALNNPMSIVTDPAKIPGLRSWTVETVGLRSVCRAAALSPDGKLYATAGVDGVIRFFDPSKGRLIKMLVNSEAGISTLAWAPDSDLLAAGTGRGGIRIWSVGQGRLLRMVPCSANRAVLGLAWSTDSMKLAVCRRGTAVEIWEMPTAREVCTLRSRDPADSYDAAALAWAPDSRHLVTASPSHGTRLWDVEVAGAFENLVDDQSTAQSSYGVLYSPDGKRIAAVTREYVIIWSAMTKQVLCVSDKEIHDGRCGRLDWSSDGNFLAVGMWNGGVILDSRDGKIVSAIPNFCYGDGLLDPAWLADNSHLLCVFGSGIVANAEATGSKWSKWSWSVRGSPNLRRVWTLPDGKRFATLAQLSSGTALRIWDITDGALLSTHNLPSPNVVALDCSKSDLLAVVGGGGLYILDLNGGQRGQELRLNEPINDVKWSSEGDTLAIVKHTSPKRAVLLGHPKSSGAPREVLQGIARPDAIDWAKGGQFLAVGWDNGDISIVDAGSDETPRHLSDTPRRGVTGLAWQSDERLLVVNGSNQVTCINPRSEPLMEVFILPKSANGVKATTADQPVVFFGPEGALLWNGVSATELFSDNRLFASLAPDGYLWNNQLFASLAPDGQALLASVEEHVVAWDLGSRKARFAQIDLDGGQHVRIRPDGQWRGSEGIEEQLVYVGLTDDGEQMTLKPREFAAKYGPQYVPPLSKPSNPKE